MRRAFVSALMMTGSVLAPAVARAQHDMGGMPPHEVGMDLGIAYTKPSSRVGIFSVGTPVDLRLGLIMHSGWSLEPRLIFLYQTTKNGSFHNVDLDLNAIVPIGSGSTYRKGMYLTGGGGLDLTGGNTTGLPSTSGTIPQLNAGIGTRVPYESAAIRLEAYLKYRFKNSNLGLTNTSEVGVRIGLSLWH